MTSRLDATHAVVRRTGVPEGWTERQVSNLAQIVSGGTPDRNESAYWRDGSIPWITPTDLTANSGKYICEGAEHISESGLANSNATLVPAGSIIFSSRGTVGNLAIAGVPLTCNQSCEVLVPSDKEVNSEFLYELLNYGMFAFHRLAGGTTFGAITRREIRRVRFAVPEDIDEQAAIARILDAVDVAIKRARESVSATKQLQLSLVDDLICYGIDDSNHVRHPNKYSETDFRVSKLGRFPTGWEISTLGKYCTKITDGTHQAVKTSRDGIPFLYVSCIRDGRINWDRAAYISERDYTVISKGREPNSDAVLYTAVGSYGYAAAIDCENKFSFQRHIAILYPKKKQLDPSYLTIWLNCPIGRRWSDILAVGNAQKTVTLTALGKFPIAVPPYDEQIRIRDLLAPVNKLLSAKEAQLSALEQLKKSLMHDLLTGTVRVDPSLIAKVSSP